MKLNAVVLLLAISKAVLGLKIHVLLQSHTKTFHQIHYVELQHV